MVNFVINISGVFFIFKAISLTDFGFSFFLIFNICISFSPRLMLSVIMISSDHIFSSGFCNNNFQFSRSAYNMLFSVFF
jgi:hypothetical protein